MDNFDFSVKCGSCNNVYVGIAKDAFSFIAMARVENWDIPDAMDNKPIRCPTCKAKQP